MESGPAASVEIRTSGSQEPFSVPSKEAEAPVGESNVQPVDTWIREKTILSVDSNRQSAVAARVRNLSAA